MVVFTVHISGWLPDAEAALTTSAGLFIGCCPTLSLSFKREDT